MEEERPAQQNHLEKGLRASCEPPTPGLQRATSGHTFVCRNLKCGPDAPSWTREMNGGDAAQHSPRVQALSHYLPTFLSRGSLRLKFKSTKKGKARLLEQAALHPPRLQ